MCAVCSAWNGQGWDKTICKTQISPYSVECSCSTLSSLIKIEYSNKIPNNEQLPEKLSNQIETKKIYYIIAVPAAVICLLVAVSIVWLKRTKFFSKKEKQIANQNFSVNHYSTVETTKSDPHYLSPIDMKNLSN